MQKMLVSVEDPREAVLKRELRNAIVRKRRILSRRMLQIAALSSELDLIQNEYSVRIGRLNLKDNELDLQLIRLNNIIDLLNSGKSPKEALEATDDMYYAEEVESMRRQRTKIDEEEAFLVREEELLSHADEKAFRDLWRSLLFKFHPDLATDDEEKERRAEIMKKINSAYETHDVKALQDIEHMHLNTSSRTVSVVELENQLAVIENKMIHADQQLFMLKASEWYVWYLKRQKTKKKEDPFRSLERRLLDDIARKIEIVSKLREELWGRQVYTV
jgi:hypothetical protein